MGNVVVGSHGPRIGKDAGVEGSGPGSCWLVVGRGKRDEPITYGTDWCRQDPPEPGITHDPGGVHTLLPDPGGVNRYSLTPAGSHCTKPGNKAGGSPWVSPTDPPV